MDLAVIAAERVLGRLSPSELQQVAWEAQAQGHDGPAIRELAAYEWSPWRGVGDLVERAVREMGLPVPSQHDAARALARPIAAAIVSGTCDAYAGACRLERLFFDAAYPGFLGEFVLPTDYYDQFPEERLRFTERIRTVARTLLEMQQE